MDIISTISTISTAAPVAVDTVDQGGAVTRGGVRRGGGEGLIILTVTRLQVLCPDTPGVNYLVWPGE